MIRLFLAILLFATLFTIVSVAWLFITGLVLAIGLILKIGFWTLVIFLILWYLLIKPRLR